jgi:ANTAR domain
VLCHHGAPRGRSGADVIESVGDRGAPASEAEVALADALAATRDELRLLRKAVQLRAVIEQAKGVLVERHGITLDEAFARLRAMSQEHNVRLVEVAATMVGVRVPALEEGEPDIPEAVLRGRLPSSPAASRAWNELRAQPDVRAGVVTALLDSVAGATSQGDDAAQLLAELLSPQRVTALTLYRTSADGSLQLVGQCGVPGDAISPWRSIPPSRDIPYVRAVQDDQAYFWGDRAERAAQFPSVTPTTRFDAAAVIPVADGGSVIGVAGLLWDSAESFGADRVEEVTRLVQRVAPLLLRSAIGADPDIDYWLSTLLDLHLDPWLLLEAIPRSDGTIRDFVVQDVAHQIPGWADWLGRRLVEMWPSAAQDGVLQGLASLVRAGGVWTRDIADGSDAPWGVPGSRLRAVRLGQLIVLVWRSGT